MKIREGEGRGGVEIASGIEAVGKLVEHWIGADAVSRGTGYVATVRAGAGGEEDTDGKALWRVQGQGEQWEVEECERDEHD